MSIRPQPKRIESLTIKDFLDEFSESLKMKLVSGEEGTKRVIYDNAINRPSLAITGFFKNFGYKRVQLFGAGEMAYLRSLNEARQYHILSKIAQKNIPCIIVSRNLAPTTAMRQISEEQQIPLIRTPLSSRNYTTTATLLLEEKFAPRLTEHGTLMDIKGTGVLIRGESGVGKSECALALIERGYSLVADDVVYIRLINERELSGTSSELNRGYMECRGLGIINIADLFGVRSVRLQKTIDMVVTFTMWRAGMEEERTGLEQDYYEVMGVSLPHIELPVRPGRDLARLVEVAAMVQALKRMGHDSAKEFNDRLILHMQKGMKGTL